MKLHIVRPAEYIIRLNIKKQPLPVRHINLCETTIEECKNMVMAIVLKQNLSPFEEGKRTTVEFRESTGDNGKAISISFRGMEPKYVESLILSYLINTETEK